MKSITKTVESFFNRQGIRFEQMDHGRGFKIGYDGKNGWFLGCIFIDEGRRTVYIRTLSPVKVPMNKRQQVAELLLRVNQHLVLGGFDLDLDSGLIAYKTGIILGEGNLYDGIIEHLLFANWLAMDKYLPAINMVIFGNICPKRAIEMVKKECSLPPDSPDDTNHDGFVLDRLGDILGGALN